MIQVHKCASVWMIIYSENGCPNQEISINENSFILEIMQAAAEDPCISSVAMLTLTVKLEEYPLPDS